MLAFLARDTYSISRYWLGLRPSDVCLPVWDGGGLWSNAST